MNEHTIDVVALQTMLQSGAPATLLDIRQTADFAEWRIPNSVHIAAIDALRTNEPNALKGLVLDKDKPIVTICGAGVMSEVATSQLRAQGYDAVSLSGGMQAWSMAWNVAEVPTNNPDLEVIQVRRTGKGCLSYMIHSDGETAVIDASLPPEVYLTLAQQRGWQITHVLDTHIHADHLSRSRMLSQVAVATLYLPAQERVGFVFTAVSDNDVIPVGAVQIEAIHSPGHTLESICYLINGTILLTGDTLFPAAVGRPDLEATPAEASERAHLLYRTLQRLLILSPTTLILAGHASEPIAFDGRFIGASLQQAVRQTAVLALDETNFVQTLLQQIPATPPNHQHIVAFNEAGQLPDGDLTEWEAGGNRCAIG